MRSTIAMATFAALAAGTAGVSALDSNAHMLGSDTLKKLTQSVLVQCGSNCNGFSYDGTGSGAGQTALTNGTQSVAPMSRALNTGICGNTGRTTAEGVVIGLDGVNIVGDSTNAGSVACNGNAATGLDTTTGLKYDVATPNSWRDVLRTLYAGMPAGTSTDPLVRDCNSSARQTLVSNWNNMFKGTCANCADSNPNAVVTEPGLRHAFRRDEESGTTDVFLGLLSLGTISFSTNEPAGYDATNTHYSYRAIANSPFCNVHRPNDMYWAVTVPANASVADVTNGLAKLIPPLVDLGVVPTTTPAQPVTARGVNGHLWSQIVDAFVFDGGDDVTFPDFQDQDPIRRKCVGDNFDDLVPGKVTPSEQVCSADGQLGVVLPINPPPADQVEAVYPATPCDAGAFDFAPGVLNSFAQGIRCPNGDEPLGAPAACRTPQSATGKYNCLNGGGQWIDIDPSAGVNLVLAANGGPAVIDGTTPGFTQGRTDIDGRVYNLVLRDAAGNPQKIGRPGVLPPASAPTVIDGAFYRIHTTRSLVGNGSTKTCTSTDATSQIGCLVQASPCSLGFAGGEAVTLNPGTVGLRVNGITPTIQNIQCLVKTGCNLYPLSRKLYVNTLLGFDKPITTGVTGTDGEIDLVRSYVTETLPLDTAGAQYPALPATAVTGPLAAAGPHVGAQYGGSALAAFGFIQLPTTATNTLAGEPFCEDFNENSCGTTNSVCSADANGRLTCPAVNVNACRAALTTAGVPDNTAFCGNGTVDQGEQCDDGNAITDSRSAANGDPTDDKCSVTCTTTN